MQKDAMRSAAQQVNYTPSAKAASECERTTRSTASPSCRSPPPQQSRGQLRHNHYHVRSSTKAHKHGQRCHAQRSTSAAVSGLHKELQGH